MVATTKALTRPVCSHPRTLAAASGGAKVRKAGRWSEMTRGRDVQRI